ncbi:MAG: hypothetical protein JXJ22_01420 [Bacteroidales bacterium]|nr:hypothetical protein [Bacteroidales bacterium]
MTIFIDPVLQDIFKKTKTICFNSQNIRLTPDGVTNFDYSGLFPPAWKPRFYAPHLEVIYKKDYDCKPLDVKEWGFKDRYTNKIQRWSSGIYTSGMQFPQYCVDCMKPATHHEVVQLIDAKNIALGKYTIPVDSQKEANRINEAYITDRYWFAVPYCKDHGLRSKAVFIKYGGEQFRFGFSNPEYGKEFARINRLKAVWRTKQFLFRTKFLYPFLLIFSGLSVFTGFLFALRGFKGGMGKATAQPTDIPVGISVIVIAIIVIIWVIRLLLVSEKTTEAVE